MALIRNMMAFLIGLFTVVSLLGVNVAEPANKQIAVLISQQASHYEEALSGFKQYFQRQGIQVDFALYPLEEGRAHSEMQNIKKSKPNLIFALGSLATEKAVSEVSDVPIIAGILLKMDPFKKASNVTGVVLEFPIETQFKWLQHILPNSRNIGTIYHPGENQERIESASKIASKMGLKLEAQEIINPQGLPEALNKLSKNSDVFWGIPDSLVLNSQTVKHILLFSFQNRIPFIGLSSSWVKAGALYSLDWDYVDMGMQCGEVAWKVLQGTPTHSIPTATPRKVYYVLNLTTANHMKVKLSDELILGAHQTF
jgi:putative ABC transport system substrate-binding protein